MARPITVFLLALPIAADRFLVTEAWMRPGHIDLAKASKATLNGHDRDDVFALQMMGPEEHEGYTTISALADVAIYDAQTRAQAELTNATEAASIIAVKLKTTFSPNDAQLVEEHFGEGEDVSAEQFFAATGTWPSSGFKIDTETAIIPTKPADAVDDILSAHQQGWSIHGLLDKWRARTSEDVWLYGIRSMVENAQKEIDSGDEPVQDVLKRLQDFLVPPTFRDIDPTKAEPIADRIRRFANSDAVKRAEARKREMREMQEEVADAARQASKMAAAKQAATKKLAAKRRGASKTSVAKKSSSTKAKTKRR
jgi:hypothetical protein